MTPSNSELPTAREQLGIIVACQLADYLTPGPSRVEERARSLRWWAPQHASLRAGEVDGVVNHALAEGVYL
jgi:hypothetical protein